MKKVARVEITAGIKEDTLTTAGVCPSMHFTSKYYGVYEIDVHRPYLPSLNLTDIVFLRLQTATSIYHEKCRELRGDFMNVKPSILQ